MTVSPDAGPSRNKTPTGLGQPSYSTFMLSPGRSAVSDPEDQHGAKGRLSKHLTRDDLGLEDLGYRPELKRNFSKLETFGVAFSIMYVVVNQLRLGNR